MEHPREDHGGHPPIRVHQVQKADDYANRDLVGALPRYTCRGNATLPEDTRSMGRHQPALNLSLPEVPGTHAKWPGRDRRRGSVGQRRCGCLLFGPIELFQFSDDRPKFLSMTLFDGGNGNNGSTQGGVDGDDNGWDNTGGNDD